MFWEALWWNKIEEGAVNAGYLCATVEEAFLSVLLHVEGTGARCRDSHGCHICLDILVWHQALPGSAVRREEWHCPTASLFPVLTSCTGTVGYLHQRGFVGAETSSLQPSAGTELAGTTGSWATVLLLPEKLQEVLAAHPAKHVCMQLLIRLSGKKEVVQKSWRFDGFLLIHHFYKCAKKMATELKFTNPNHVYTHSLVLEFYLAFSWNLSGMQLFKLPYSKLAISLYSWPFIFLLKYSDCNSFFLIFHWMKQCD